jgi:hypothetical protein
MSRKPAYQASIRWLQGVKLLISQTNGAKAILVHPDYLNDILKGLYLGALASFQVSRGQLQGLCRQSSVARLRKIFSIKESFRMAHIRPLMGTKNVLTEILFLRNKSRWERWFPGTDQNKTKSILHQSLVRHALAHLPYLDVLVESETCFGMCSPWVKSNLSFISWCMSFFFFFCQDNIM